jgi:hypothetical protein
MRILLMRKRNKYIRSESNTVRNRSRYQGAGSLKDTPKIDPHLAYIDLSRIT